MNFKCEECECTDYYTDKMYLYDVVNNDKCVEKTYCCHRCNTTYLKIDDTFIHINKHTYNSYLSRYYFTISTEEALAIISEKSCAISGEKIGNKRFGLAYQDEKLYFYIKAFQDDLSRCYSCSKKGFEEEINNKFYVNNNNCVTVCDGCSLKFEPYNFGYNFRKLKGRTNKDNPFERYVGIELETIKGDYFNYFSIPEEFRDCVASTYDGSLYDSNVYGEEDDDNSPVNSVEYNQESDEELRGAGREFVLVPLAQDKLFNTVDDLCKFLRGHNCKINKSCGMHIHFDMGNESISTVRKTFLLFSILEDVLFDMLPKSRRNNRYCIPLKKDYKSFFQNEFDEFWYGTKDRYQISRRKESKWQNTRYSAINYHALFFHGTLENRMHSGTLNPKKIKNWILINNIIIEYAKRTSVKKILKLSGTRELLFSIIDDFEKDYPVLKKYELVDYILERTNKFKKDTGRPIKVIRNIKPNVADDIIAVESFKDFFNSNDDNQEIDVAKKSSSKVIIDEMMGLQYNNNSFSSMSIEELENFRRSFQSL